MLRVVVLPTWRVEQVYRESPEYETHHGRVSGYL